MQPFRRSRRANAVWIIGLFSALFSPGTCANTFNYDVNARVQENVASLLHKIAQTGDIAYLQLQSGNINISDFNASMSGWKAGSAFTFGLKRVFREEIILVHIGIGDLFRSRLYLKIC